MKVSATLHTPFTRADRQIDVLGDANKRPARMRTRKELKIIRNHYCVLECDVMSLCK